MHACQIDFGFAKLDYNLSEAGTRKLLHFLKGVCACRFLGVCVCMYVHTYVCT